MNYLRPYLKNWRTTGSIMPSSRFLAGKMTAPIDFSSAKMIVELGPGTGCFTKAILARMRPDAKLYAIEIQTEFVNELRKIKDKRLKIIHGSAEKIPVKADYIISGLPLVSLPKQAGENIIKAVLKSLRPDGKYIQFQYSLKSYKKFKTLFKEVKLSFTPLNVPPAFVYTCSKVIDSDLTKQFSRSLQDLKQGRFKRLAY